MIRPKNETPAPIYGPPEVEEDALPVETFAPDEERPQVVYGPPVE